MGTTFFLNPQFFKVYIEGEANKEVSLMWCKPLKGDGGEERSTPHWKIAYKSKAKQNSGSKSQISSRTQSNFYDEGT